jgi:hypothetical protein
MGIAMSDSAPPSSKGFWNVLGAVTAAVAAVATLITALHGAGWIGEKKSGDTIRVEVAPPAVAPDAQQAVEMQRLREEMRVMREQFAAVNRQGQAVANPTAQVRRDLALAQQSQADAELVEARLARLQAALSQASLPSDQAARNVEFERIKSDIQKLSQMQQAMSNVLDTKHEQAMQAIRHIKP